MKTNGNSILLVGGDAGIWPVLAEGFILAGNEVIVCGRSQETLDRALRRLPSLNTFMCDVSLEEDRQVLSERVREYFPRLNLLVHCAEVEETGDLIRGDASARMEKELATGIQAPVLLTLMLLPHLLRQPEAGVIFVAGGSGTAGAGMRGFARSVRRQLSPRVSVFDVACEPHQDGGSFDAGGQLLRGLRRGEPEIRLGPPRKFDAVTRLLRLNTLLST